MQNFSTETLTTIKKALEAQIQMAKMYGLVTYTEEAQEALDIVNEYLGDNS